MHGREILCASVRWIYANISCAGDLCARNLCVESVYGEYFLREGSVYKKVYVRRMKNMR
jgi:hypothetical protein